MNSFLWIFFQYWWILTFYCYSCHSLNFDNEEKGLNLKRLTCGEIEVNGGESWTCWHVKACPRWANCFTRFLRLYVVVNVQSGTRCMLTFDFKNVCVPFWHVTIVEKQWEEDGFEIWGVWKRHTQVWLNCHLLWVHGGAKEAEV